MTGSPAANEICPTCRTWFGPYMAQDYAERVARFDHDHPSQKPSSQAGEQP